MDLYTALSDKVAVHGPLSKFRVFGGFEVSNRYTMTACPARLFVGAQPGVMIHPRIFCSAFCPL